MIKYDMIKYDMIKSSSKHVVPIKGGQVVSLLLSILFSSHNSKSIVLPSSLIQFFHLCLGFPRGFFPSSSLSAAHLIISSSSHLRTCPYHLNLLSCTLSLICTTSTFLGTSSFMILSLLVTPLIALRHIISATHSLHRCSFFTAHV